MNILVLNCGSSSVKYQLFNMDNESVLAKGMVERIGIEGASLIHYPEGQEKVVIEKEIPDHNAAVQLCLEALINPTYGVIENYNEINAIGHRIVHGGQISNSSLIDQKIKDMIRDLIKLAPLHNGPGLRGIEACEAILPGVPQVAVFDTSFHQTMPDYAYIYSLPYELYENHNIRRYGFHGTSHKYVALRAAALVEKPLEELKLITCHLGNGSSIAAIKYGKVQDTSMGFTPLAGLTMGTRCGDIDPAIVTYLQNQGYTSEEIDRLMNKQSGVLGVSGVSSDFRDVESAMLEGNDRARLAWDIFVYTVKKFIGSYIAVLNGLDILVFTAGLGENFISARQAICKDMDYVGIEIDENENKVRGCEKEITAAGSKARVFVIPTNEELMIARDTKNIVSNVG
ncbi:MAG: acetate kinase [Clostridia bacterium]|nr:acetate kinase [Clostridia bacterium]